MDTRGRVSKRRRLTRGGTAAGASGDDSAGLGSVPTARAGDELPCTSFRPSKDTGSDSAKEVASHGTFYPFQRLPPELRLQVWRELAQDACEPFHPLRVRLYRGTERVHRPNNKRSYWTKSVLRLAAMPDLAVATKRRRALLQISREARHEVMKLWDMTVNLERGRVLHFSFAHDIVYLDIINPVVMKDLMVLHKQGELPEFANAIGHVGFDMTPSVPLWMINNHDDLEPQLRLLLCFPRLHSLSLVTFGAFRSEIDWTSDEDVSWVMSRTRSHHVYLRSFPALVNFDYSVQGAVGNRTSGGHDKHDCAICTIHKCVYLSDVLSSKKHEELPRSELPREQVEWLSGLAHHTLIAATPLMAKRVPSYQSNTVGWWINRPQAQQVPRNGDADEDDEYDHHHHHYHHGHDHGDSDDSDEDGGDGDEEDEYDDDDDIQDD